MYAIDVRRITFDKPFVAPVYHILTWFGSLACCTTGLTLLYLPGIGYILLKHSAIKLKSKKDFITRSDPYIRVLPNHVASYFPLVLTCLTCPFLFWSAFRQAGVSLSLRYARYTTKERRLIESLRLKFLLIVGVFYLCWMPNLVNGLVLWLSWSDLPVTWVLANWYLMVSSVFNVLNCSSQLNFLFTTGPTESTSNSVQCSFVQTTQTTTAQLFRLLCFTEKVAEDRLHCCCCRGDSAFIVKFKIRKADNEHVK